MHATESPSPTLPAVTADRRGELRVDCYVRSRMPGPTGDRIAAVVDSLQRLDEADAIAAYRITQWPAEHHVAAQADDTQRATRHELVTEFERWAEQRGYSLEPAFRRRTLPSWPLGSEDAERRERVRVPVVALALYDTAELDGENQRSTETPVNPGTDALCGVVPCTDASRADEQGISQADDDQRLSQPGDDQGISRTADQEISRAGAHREICTVTEWLSAVESAWCESAATASKNERRSVLEGQ